MEELFVRTQQDEMIDEFLSLVHFDSSGCWLWQGRIDHKGYGRFKSHSKGLSNLAHRYAHRLLEDINYPSEVLLLHSCDIKRCVNPEHSNPGTTQQNTLDMMLRSKPSGCCTPQFTSEQVKSIRQLREFGVKLRVIAGNFGASEPQISAICNRKTYKHIQ